MHEFRLRKDSAGVMRLKVRKSSKAFGWIPDGPAGYEVFKIDPPQTLKPAKFKADSVWNRTQVEATLRQWFPFMAVSPVERTSVEQQWTSACFSLPIDMQPDQLPPEKLLSTPSLPARSWVTRAAARAPSRSPSANLENPVINPTHGYGRSAGEVAREARAFREAARANATGVTPIFKGDYLFVQLPGSSAALHQVCNGALLERATHEEMSFSTVEFTHSPQQLVPEFFGTFEKKLKPTFNAMDSKSGTKFIRHSGISREHVQLLVGI